MDSIRSPLAALAALLVVWWLHLRHSLQRLPARIATHFDGAGVPNGWMPREALGTFDMIFLAFVLAVVIGTALLIRVLPTTLINLPNRDYWFAPERRRQSHSRLLVHMLWLACLLVAFLIAVNRLVFLANLRPGPPRLSGAGFVTVLVGFLLALVGWVVRLHRMFPRPTARN
jgi:serine/threonine-protein kinase